MVRIKITVVKKLKTEDIFGHNVPKISEEASCCERFEEGDTFISEDVNMGMPGGWPCPWAYNDIYRGLVVLQYGGDFRSVGIKEKGLVYLACTDGLRPVIFKLERLEESTSCHQASQSFSTTDDNN